MLNDMFMSKKITPISRGFYSFDKIRAGDFLIYIDSTKSHYKFVYVPGADFFYLSKEDFKKAIELKVLTFVEQIPQDIFDETLNFSLSTLKKVEK